MGKLTVGFVTSKSHICSSFSLFLQGETNSKQAFFTHMVFRSVITGSQLRGHPALGDFSESAVDYRGSSDSEILEVADLYQGLGSIN
jgi:hypothetical protein